MVEQIAKDMQSLLNDQQRCVSVGDAMRLGVSRFQLASLLQQQQEDSSSPKIAMRCETSKDRTAEGIPITVFKLRKASNGQEEPRTAAMVYAISQSESLSASQERRLADLRDRSKDHRLVQINPDGILANPKFQQTSTTDAAATAAALPKHTDVEAPKASLLLQRARKPTTAQNFFKKEGKENGDKATKPSATTISVKPDRKRNAAAATKNSKKTSKPTERKIQAESAKTIGTVDDFQGDVDDGDDDSSVEAPPKPKSPKKKPKTAPPVERRAKPAYDGPIAKRRRKVRKTKCTVDDKGYMVTEHYDEWEDIPSDEEEKEEVKVVPKKKPAAKAKPSLKQGSLTGFFKKA